MRPGTGSILPWATVARPVLTIVDPLAVLFAGVLVLGSVGPLPLLGSSLAAGFVCRSADLHRARLVLSVVEDLPGLVAAALAAVLVLAGLGAGLDLDGPDLTRAAAFGATAFAAAVLARTAAYAVTHLLRRRGVLSRAVVIVGAGSVGRRLAVTLMSRPEHGLRPVGIVDSAPPSAVRDLPLPLLGEIDELLGVLSRLEVRDVLFAFATPPDQLTVAAVRACLVGARQVFVVPRFYEATGRDRRLRTELVDDVAVVRLRRLGASRSTRAVRRVGDVVVATCGLVVLAPVLLVLAAAVRLENGPTVLVRQTRVGVGGRPFTVLRLRSVRPTEPTADATSWSIDANSRGPVGRFLRHSGLDELPQLFDVLRGALSIDARDRRETQDAEPGWWEQSDHDEVNGSGALRPVAGRGGRARGLIARRRG